MSLAPPEEDDNPQEDGSQDELPTVEVPRERTRPRHRKPARAGLRDGMAERAGQLSTLSVAVLANILVIVILAAGLIFTIIRLGSEDSTDSMRASALNASRTYGVYLSSYDYRNLNGPGSPWAAVEAHATPKFKKAFSQTSGDLAKLLTQYDATAKGTVIDAGLSSLHGSRAVILLFIDQAVTNTVQKPNTVVQPLRVRVTLVNQGGHWLIDNLEVPK